MKHYGLKPVNLGKVFLDCKEMMFYQYLPIKMNKSIFYRLEDRLLFLENFIDKVETDFIKTFGLDEYSNSYVYLTIKRMYQSKDCSYNRLGYHTDGFGTDDINYIWSNCNPTIFNIGKFILSEDDNLSIEEMNTQALSENEIIYPDNTLLRLNDLNVHKVNDNDFEGYRTFIKISISKDKYDLEGNSHNYLFNYNWNMKVRNINRNIPQNIIKHD